MKAFQRRKPLTGCKDGHEITKGRHWTVIPDIRMKTAKTGAGKCIKSSENCRQLSFPLLNKPVRVIQWPRHPHLQDKSV